MKQKRLVCSTDDSDEMCLKCLDGLFCDASVVVIWWNELIRHTILCNRGLEVRGTFVVKDEMLWLDSCSLEAVYKMLVRAYHLT
jgi:hypothetical protein